MKIIKRNGVEMEFDKNKIITAITKANNEVNENERLIPSDIFDIATNIETKCFNMYRVTTIEIIQDMVEMALMEKGKYTLAQKYIRYRHSRELLRKSHSTDDTIMSLIELNNEDIKEENSNKNCFTASTQRDYMSGEVSKDISERMLLPKKIVDAHKEGIIHFHDMDYFVQHIHNCCLINLDDMLQNGTVISETMIEKPHKFITACNIATQIIAQVASSQYGGQSITLTHLAPFVNDSRKILRKKIADEAHQLGITKNDEEKINQIAEQRLLEEINAGVQVIQYQLLTLMTTNGQTPFVTLFMDINEPEDEQTRGDLALIIEEVLRQRILGVKNEVGAYITPAFPKLIYVLDENNTYPESKYYYLTLLSANCTAKRLVPDYISAKKMREIKDGNVFPCMGCRSFLSVYKDPKTDKPKFYGRFNQGVVTINLVDVALSSGKSMEKFWQILDDRLENLCYPALMERHKRLRGTVTDVAPILWQHGALSRLKKGETIDKLLINGYSTISLGYAGVYECVYYMTGKSHTDKEATPFALDIMRYLTKKCEEWKEKTTIGFSVYGTPIESTTYKFAKCLKKRFGIVEHVTDHDYITNSFHVNVTEPINPFDKLKFESQFQELSVGGTISYIETTSLSNNIEAVVTVLKYIYDNIMYAELNTKSDYCHECGYDGEIEIKEEESGKLIWKCPNCGNTDQSKMNVARRTCGYIGSQFWNQGRTAEIKDRYSHLDNHDSDEVMTTINN